MPKSASAASLDLSAFILELSRAVKGEVRFDDVEIRPLL